MGKQFQKVEEQRQQQANRMPTRTELLRPSEQSEGCKGASMDGAMVHILEEGLERIEGGLYF